MNECEDERGLELRNLSCFQVLRGRRYTKGYNGGQPFEEWSQKDAEALPDSYDWRLYGAVTPVKGNNNLLCCSRLL